MSPASKGLGADVADRNKIENNNKLWRLNVTQKLHITT